MASSLENFPVGPHNLTLRVGDDAFRPTQTTQRLAEMAEIPPGSTVLDLGCGVGPIAIIAALRGAKKVYAVDVVPQAVAYARENVERAGVADRVTVHCGDLFEPVKSERFDVIVNDVSGIADKVARLSPWYPTPVPTGGEDGTDVVTRMLSQAPDHLTPGGVLYFATSSLSDAGKIVKHAKSVFKDKVEQLASHRFPFCPEFTQAMGDLLKLREAGKISWEDRRSRQIWTLDLYRAKLT
ncbi:MAG: methyltransferase [Phycisphaeraceae bacterium]|nr:methyltransferase [Phycisphaeraceae bacterium]